MKATIRNWGNETLWGYWAQYCQPAQACYYRENAARRPIEAEMRRRGMAFVDPRPFVPRPKGYGGKYAWMWGLGGEGPAMPASASSIAAEIAA